MSSKNYEQMAMGMIRICYANHLQLFTCFVPYNKWVTTTKLELKGESRVFVEPLKVEANSPQNCLI